MKDRVDLLVELLLRDSFIGQDDVGGVSVDYSLPRRPGAISTEVGHKGKPYRRERTLENGKRMVMYAAYQHDHAPSDLLNKVKDAGQQVVKFVEDGALFLAPYLTFDFSAMVPVSSSKPMAEKFADNLALLLDTEVRSVAHKEANVRLSRVPIHLRKMRAHGVFSVSDKLSGNVLVVDDLITTGMSLAAVAVKCYEAGAEDVVGAALIIGR